MAEMTTSLMLNQDNPFSYSVYAMTRRAGRAGWRMGDRVAVINRTSMGWEARGMDGAYLDRAESAEEVFEALQRFAGQA